VALGLTMELSNGGKAPHAPEDSPRPPDRRPWSPGTIEGGTAQAGISDGPLERGPRSR
jgi:hypothetical protein